MNVLVTGISGYIGSLLAPRLRADGHSVRGLSRIGRRDGSGVEIVVGDAISGDGLNEAMRRIDVAYYLIHSMEPADDGALAVRERRAAQNFADAAARAGVRRIVYLGGLMPRDAPLSQHLASRREVEDILRGATQCTAVLRASIVIGANSRPFRLLVRLVERMPVLVLPGWHANCTSPIDERDVVELLTRAATDHRACGEPLDAPGPQQLTYGELIAMIRDHLLIARPTVSLRRVTATPLVSHIVSTVSGEEYELVGPLMESLRSDLLPGHRTADAALGVRLHSLDAAIERALREWERAEPLAAR